ncbi:hypothetical protein AVEN_76351-1 [Araneus ventricosus]|uniref:Uncharacterized protein n=1 Tax=Araneus ventricosus TaxID=182803 RepID=A0A4Y2FPX5_ARAVE|nr:hypothetical protein AVEN_76351-1 [Araneus ventricosus]
MAFKNISEVVHFMFFQLSHIGRGSVKMRPERTPSSWKSSIHGRRRGPANIKGEVRSLEKGNCGLPGFGSLNEAVDNTVASAARCRSNNRKNRRAFSVHTRLRRKK